MIKMLQQSRYFANAYCGLLRSDKFCKIFVFHEDTECYYDCGINKRYSNIKFRWKDLTSRKMLEYVNVYARNGEIVGNVMRLKNKQIANTICQWTWNAADLAIKVFVLLILVFLLRMMTIFKINEIFLPILFEIDGQIIFILFCGVFIIET